MRRRRPRNAGRGSFGGAYDGEDHGNLRHSDVREFFYCADAVVETARDYWKLHRAAQDVLHEKEPHDITIDALREFISRIRDGTSENMCIPAAESTLTAIMARTSMDLGREVTWKEVIG
jgi:hypothetical protein